MNLTDLSDYKQLPTVQAELSDLQPNTLGVAQFIKDNLRDVYPELEEHDFVRVEVIGTIEVTYGKDFAVETEPFVEGYFLGRIAEFDLDTGAATITLIRS